MKDPFQPLRVINLIVFFSKTASGSIQVVEKLSFSTVPSILTCDFDLIFGFFFLLLWALMGYFWGRSRVEKLFWGALM